METKKRILKIALVIKIVLLVPFYAVLAQDIYLSTLQPGEEGLPETAEITAFLPTVIAEELCELAVRQQAAAGQTSLAGTASLDKETNQDDTELASDQSSNLSLQPEDPSICSIDSGYPQVELGQGTEIVGNVDFIKCISDELSGNEDKRICTFKGKFEENKIYNLVYENLENEDKEFLAVVCKIENTPEEFFTKRIDKDKAECVSGVESVFGPPGLDLDYNFVAPELTGTLTGRFPIGDNEIRIKANGEFSVSGVGDSGEDPSVSIKQFDINASYNLGFTTFGNSGTFGYLDSEGKIPRVYFLVGNVGLGIDIQDDFKVVQLPIEGNLKVEVPGTDFVIEAIHNVLNVERARYPMVFGVKLRYAPLLAGRSLVSDDHITNYFELNFAYNIPLMENLDLETRWQGRCCANDKFLSKFTMGIKVFVFGDFDNYLTVTYDTGSDGEGAQPEAESSLSLGLSSSLDKLLGQK